MKKRVYTKASDWLPLIKEWQQSGFSKKVFCEHKQVSYKKFYRWYSRLLDAELRRPGADKPLSKSSSLFVPVKVKEATEVGTGAEVCVLRLSSQLHLQIPVKAMTVGFLRILFESVGTQLC